MAKHPIDAVIDSALREGRVIGTTVLVQQHGRRVYERHAGRADRETGAPVRADSLWLLASIAKLFTTVAVLRLTEQGRLDLQAPVTRYLPDFRPALADGRRPDITLHHLLTHTSGLSYRFLAPLGTSYDAAGVSDGLDDIGVSLGDNLSRIASVPLAFEPGTAWQYSVSIDVLGAVIESVAGERLGDVVAQLVTDPLGITDTGFTTEHPERIVAHYGLIPGEGLVRIGENTEIPSGPVTSTRFHVGRVLDSLAFHSGGAGMVGSPYDVLRLLEALRGGGDRVLAPESAKSMFTAHVGAGQVAEGPGWGFGYGGAVLVDPAATGTPQPVGALAWGGAYGHKWFIDRDRELSIVALTNVGFEGLFGKYTQEVRDAIYRIVD